MSKFYYNEEQESYDAIVVGTGISGGWAAKELCEAGLKTLVLERGRMVKHIEDYETANMDPWDFPNGGKPTKEDIAKQPKQNRTGYTTNAASKMWFVNDLEHPYNEIQRFDWMRGYHVGGRSLQWGRQSYRWSDIDFEANKNDGIAVDWPVRYKDIAPWYAKVEDYIGVSGEALNLPQLPDSNFLPQMELNCVEEHFKEKVAESFDGRTVTVGRVAHITGTKNFDGRSKCQFRNRCIRGCPFGAYFSSLSSTLPAAEATGNMTLRPDSIVHEVMYDPDTKRATGVKVIDRESKEAFEFKAKVIFLCASSIASTSILMQSKSDRFPNGMGNDSDQLGRNIMDHHLGVGASGKFDGFDDKYYKGRRPNGVYIPRFRNLGGDTNRKDYKRGFGYQGGASRGNWEELIAELSYGKDLKDAILKPGGWTIGIGGFGEVLPYEDNRMTLDYDKLDSWGLPTVTFDAGFKENELNMRKDMMESAIEMLEKAGVRDVKGHDRETGLGLGIHEMGTARMGRDRKTSVLNGYNQIHDVPNVYVTDGSFMTSASCVNPSLTYMAFTARAANHAVNELKKGNI
ncbi:GMC family oxidoreductase [Zobellia galactanivorans]|uniref:FAD-dependent oxidoreductase n=1 Tax=Zobellia galactanivorans (strain DSM 12802 / CCUG 47099 / CIP 106680 / NCIMB 13871 / Dsij) TaxID=63186 RepID=G0LBD0_ZOBGA|nr:MULTISPECIES: GMC family oxidoreductase [Zobellia]MBU3026537.1 GMC family oxidoreductase [Zobellia galactanivorans]MDO6809321.1 GMC family oxidoreductase [Zobellia galactanivorans]OWW26960.1 GMC family oxidoreductase [Zobellia sp. OII3]CAZ95968.1 FAD-dependent oxidoreductase [Zobellia galactanivorans]